jgi:hypothetical protein
MGSDGSDTSTTSADTTSTNTGVTTSSTGTPDVYTSQYGKAAPEQGGYANEGDPSWEDVIAMVVIPGEPERARQAADLWDKLFKEMREVKRVLDDGLKDLENWKGAGGEAYRQHLTAVSTSLGQLADKHSDLPYNLRAAATDLQSAIDTIPIPEDMVHEVTAAKRGYIDTGKITTGLFHAGAFFDKLLPIYSSKWFDEVQDWPGMGWASKKLRDWISGEDNKAVTAYKSLAGQHVSTMTDMPGPTQSQYQDPSSQVTPVPPGNPGGPGAGGLPKGGGLPGSGGLPGGGDLPGSGDLPGGGDFPGSGDLPGSGAGDLPGTGLAGAGDGLVSAPGAGGLGSGLGPGAGLGSGGVGGLSGPGSGGLGRGAGGGLPGAGGLGSGMMPLGGGGKGGGRSVTGAGAGGKPGVRGAATGRGAAGGRSMGMVPGAGGAHGGAGEGEDHTTWLEEDDDVWGTDSDAPPSVLS